MTMRFLLIECALALIALVGFAPTAAVAAPQPKVEICHIPPGNPDNFHTITVGQSALAAHLAHGDLGGACDSLCAIICDDGDACTIDDNGDCEDVGCPTTPVPVDCDDENACTDDSCDPDSGCLNEPRVCDAPDLCTMSECAPDTGECVDSPLVCPDGTQCDPNTGECESSPDPECTGETCATFTTCNEGGSCGSEGVCGSTAEGGGVCVDGATPCGGLADCPNGTIDCEIGDICIVESCCERPVCVPSSQVCSDPDGGFPSEAEVLMSTESMSGPTISTP